MAVMPSVPAAASTRAIAGGEWPNIEPVSPKQKST
jgi:hypothetical protein